MCNRVATPREDEIQGYFDKLSGSLRRLFVVEPFVPYYHVSSFPMPKLPFVAMDDPDRVAPAMWKFMPERATIDVFKKYDTANAKAEEIFEKQTYRKSIASSRGIVILKGFFEGMEQPDKTVQPYFIYPANGDMLMLGCVYSDWHNPELGATVRTFSIITTNANLRMAQIHNKKRRMPLVILPGRMDEWLDNLSPTQIKEMMQPLPDGYLADHQVSRDLYKSKVDTNLPSILDRVSPLQFGGTQETLF